MFSSNYKEVTDNNRSNIYADARGALFSFSITHFLRKEAKLFSSVSISLKRRMRYVYDLANVKR